MALCNQLEGNKISTEKIISIAFDRLDRHVPFFMDSVKSPPGVTLKPLEIGLAEKKPYRDGYDRHGRMFRDQEFDACEQSLASVAINTQARARPRSLQFCFLCASHFLSDGKQKGASIVPRLRGCLET